MNVRILFDFDRPGITCDPPAASLGIADLTLSANPRDAYRPRRPNRCRQFGARCRPVALYEGDCRCRRCGQAFALTVTMSRPPLELPTVNTEAL